MNVDAFTFSYAPRSRPNAGERGTYLFTQNPLRNGVIGTVIFCPNCGHGIGLQQQINEIGVATPSVGCPRCNWHCAVATLAAHGAEKRLLFAAMRKRIDMENGNEETSNRSADLSATANSTATSGSIPSQPRSSAPVGNASDGATAESLPNAGRSDADNHSQSGSVGAATGVRADDSSASSVDASSAGDSREGAIVTAPVGTPAEGGTLGANAKAEGNSPREIPLNPDGSKIEAPTASTPVNKANGVDVIADAQAPGAPPLPLTDAEKNAIAIEPAAEVTAEQAAVEPPSLFPDGTIDPSHPAVARLVRTGKVSLLDLDGAQDIEVLGIQVVSHGSGLCRVMGVVNGLLHEAFLALEHFEQRVKEKIVDGCQTFRAHSHQELEVLCHLTLCKEGKPVIPEPTPIEAPAQPPE